MAWYTVAGLYIGLSLGGAGPAYAQTPPADSTITQSITLGNDLGLTKWAFIER